MQIDEEELCYFMRAASLLAAGFTEEYALRRPPHLPLSDEERAKGRAAIAYIVPRVREQCAPAMTDVICPVCNGEMADQTLPLGTFCAAGCRDGMLLATSAQVLNNVRPFWLNEGERMERARIVEFLKMKRDSANLYRISFEVGALLEQIERGEHMKDIQP